MAAATVRRLTKRDVAFAVRLTETERWGYTRPDFVRLLDLEPGGCFLAELGGKRVGITCSTSYGPLAFIGAVIVEPSVRGKGVGDALLRATLDYLDGRGVETARLNAYLNVVPFYERLGFHGEYENSRYTGRLVGAGARPAGVRRMRSGDLTKVIEFDAPLFGAPRGALLARLAKEFRRSAFVAARGAAIEGYIVGNPEAACEIGPWVVDPDHPEAASELLHAVLAEVHPTEVGFSVPKANPREAKMAAELRLTEALRTLRMYRGRTAHGGNPEAIFAMAGLEKG